jgi:WD40 repeat protein
MAAVPLAARVVEVITEVGGATDSGYRYGSGCIVRGRTVLTAAHVVAGAVSVVVRGPGKVEYTATVDQRFVGDVDGPGPDVALVEIDDPAFSGDLPPIELARVDRDSAAAEPVERCHAVGYPWFAEVPSRVAVRETVDAIGVVPVLSNLAAGLLSVQVTIAPRELPPQDLALGASQWSGMSGAPVVASGCLLGVVTEHAPREGPSTVTAVPLTALQADPAHEEWGPGVADPAAWWSRLGVQGIGELRRLPVPPPPRPEPAYRATVREFGRTLHQRMPQLLGRDRELAEIGAFAAGGEGYRWLVGGPFTGKTALLYEAVTVGLPDEVDVVCYFLSRRGADASSGRFLAAVVPQLAYLCDVDAPDANVDQYHALWQRAAARAAQSGRHLLLVVDGLDEDLLPPESPSVASLLPTMAGAHAHVLVASRPRPGLPNDVPGGHPLTAQTPTELSPFKGAQKLSELAKKEIYDLTHGDDTDLAVDLFGLLTAAAGPLSVMDLVALWSDGKGQPTSADTRRVRWLVADRAARSLEAVGSPGDERYQFAHGSLLEYAQTAQDRTAQDLRDPEYRHRIHRWAERWQEADWPTAAGGIEGTPQYLLDTYPSTLADDPRRQARLVGDIGWIEAAIVSVGVDRVMADVREATAANSASTEAAAVLATVAGQAHNLRPPQPVGQPGYILRQLWMRAAELTENDLAEEIRSRLLSRASGGLVPRWTTRRASRALSVELGRHDWVAAVAVLADGRVVTGGHDGRVLVWDPDRPGTGSVELGRYHGDVRAAAVLADGRAVTVVQDRHHESGKVLVWDPDRPGTTPVELGRRDRTVRAVAVLADGRVVTVEHQLDHGSGEVLVWDPDHPETGSVELGRYHGDMGAVAVLADGRVVTGGDDGRVLVWDPDRPGTGPTELARSDPGVGAVAVLPDGRVVTGGDGWVLVWDPDRPGTGPTELGNRSGRHWYPVDALAVLADGRVVTGGRKGRVLVWDLDHPKRRPAKLGRHDDTVGAVAVLADGRVVTGGYYDGRVLVWDPGAAETGLAKLGRRDRTVGAVAVLADGRVVTGGRNGRVLVWDPDHPKRRPAELGRHYSPVNAVAVLADGRVVTVGNDGRVLVWDPDRPGSGPTELGNRSGRHWYTVDAVAVLADGRVVTAGDDRWVVVWNPDRPGTGPTELGQPDRTAKAVAVLADGRVVTGGDDGRVLVWDPDRPGTGPADVGRYDPGVGAVAVLPDGRVVTGGNDGRVLVWDPNRPGTAPSELGHHDRTVNAVAMLPDGRVVTGGDDRRVLVWDPTRSSNLVAQLNCSVAALAAAPLAAKGSLAIAHEFSGISLWSFKDLNEI